MGLRGKPSQRSAEPTGRLPPTGQLFVRLSSSIPLNAPCLGGMQWKAQNTTDGGAMCSIFDFFCSFATTSPPPQFFFFSGLLHPPKFRISRKTQYWDLGFFGNAEAKDTGKKNLQTPIPNLWHIFIIAIILMSHQIIGTSLINGVLQVLSEQTAILHVHRMGRGCWFPSPSCIDLCMLLHGMSFQGVYREGDLNSPGVPFSLQPGSIYTVWAQQNIIIN